MQSSDGKEPNYNVTSCAYKKKYTMSSPELNYIFVFLVVKFCISYFQTVYLHSVLTYCNCSFFLLCAEHAFHPIVRSCCQWLSNWRPFCICSTKFVWIKPVHGMFKIEGMKLNYNVISCAYKKNTLSRASVHTCRQPLQNMSKVMWAPVRGFWKLIANCHTIVLTVDDLCTAS